MSLENLNEDALRELELWPLVEMQRSRAGKSTGAPAGRAADATVERAQPGVANARPGPREEARAQPQARPIAREELAPRAALANPERPVVRAPVVVVPSSGLGTADWNALRTQVADCKACGLCKQRKQAVFGVGSETGPWLFVGEGPGADEDAQGEPFVGQAGKLLDAMLAAANLQRGRDTYIANVVKCRPPGNRTPTLDEAAACAAYLDRQIELISPKVIVGLGKTAATRLLGHEASLASLRGKVHNYLGYPVVITYHPAYLLRNLPDKAKTWEDLLFARRVFAEA
jgi:uracil-DNA glycosylase family 4